MKFLNVKIKDKVAIYQRTCDENSSIVCGNDDYVIKFSFDDEWSQYADKFALVKWNGKYEDVEIKDDECRLPAVFNTSYITVGVCVGKPDKPGPLRTTVVAKIGCRPGGFCGDEAPSEGNESHYASEAEKAAERAEKAAADTEDAVRRLGNLESTLDEVEAARDETVRITEEAKSIAESAEKAAAAAVDATNRAVGVAEHLPALSEDGYWMLWNPHIGESGAYEKTEFHFSDGVDGLFVNPDDGKLYLTAAGTVVSTGVELPESGTGFDSIVMDETGYLHVQFEGQDVVDPVYVGVGGGGSSSVLQVKSEITKDFTVINTAGEVLVEYTVTSLYNDEPTGEYDEEWFVNGSRVAIRSSMEQGTHTFDVKPYLNEGTSNTVQMKATDSFDNTRSVKWTIKVDKYGMTWNLTDIDNYGTNPLKVRLVLTGTGEKIARLFVDGAEVFSKSVTVDGGAVGFTISPQSHGVHSISATMETIVDGIPIPIDPLNSVGIWVEDDNEETIVATASEEIRTTQYATVPIRYMVYTPGSETSEVHLCKRVVEDGETTEKVISTVTADRSVQTWSYKATDAVGEDGVGTILPIKSGSGEATVTVYATGIGYDISPVTDNLEFDVNPEGHSNGEANRNSFGYLDEKGENHPFVFSENFDWIHGGFQRDDEGVTAFVVKRGCYVLADRSLFSNSSKTDGKHIKLIFKSAMVRDPNTDIITNMYGGVGLSMRAEGSTISEGENTIVTPYCTDKKIEMDFAIEPESKTGTSDDKAQSRFACVYLKSSPSRGMNYSGSWQQTILEGAKDEDVYFKIGSDEADVWIYRIKAYSRNLTRREVLQNYIADCSNPEEMVNRYERNDVFDANGAIDFYQLSKKNPKLRVFHIKGDKMTTSKEDEVSVDVEMLYDEGGESHHFTAQGVIMKAQGTSSLEYIAAALNLDLDFGDATSWVNGNGEEISSYAFSENAIPVDYFNLKADVASCEKTNNVLNVERYHRFNPFKFKGKVEDPRVRDTIEGHPCAVFFTNTSSKTIAVGDRSLAPGKTMLYFAGNMNNSKKNFAVFGQDSAAYPDQCCVEIMNNNALECRYKAVIGTNEKWDDLTESEKKAGVLVNNFQFRFPKKPTDEMKERFKAVQRWIVSTDSTAATNEPLGASVDYGEKDIEGQPIVYDNDSAEYRKAKFIHEIGNYFHVDNLDFHYLYTEFTCGVDNRAKNTFMSYEPDADGNWKWSFRTHYDHDTSYGNDNSGGLTFEYGLEDIDRVGNADVFNASDSVLWCNVRDLRGDQLHDMYVNRESAGCWDADGILEEFNAYQSIRPEALEMEDAHNKYRVPLAARYRSMMLGTKEYQRDYFIPKQAVYMASKHRGSLCTQHKITIRANVLEGSKATNDIEGVVPFTKMYLRCQFGNVGEAVVRATAGQVYTLICPNGANLDDNGATLNDLETYIFSSRDIVRVGSLASLYPKLVDFSDAPLIRKAEIGSGAVGYSNTSMNTSNTGGVSFRNNPYLELIDLRNTPLLAQSLDLLNCTSLEELYTSGSGITGVDIAQGSPIRRIELNNVKKLIARDLSKIESFTVGSANLESIWVENCPEIDTLSIVKAAPNLLRGRLTDVDWTDDNADTILRLARLKGYDEFGNESDDFVLRGSVHLHTVSQDELDLMHERFSDLAIEYEEIVGSYVVTFYNYDGTYICEQDVREGGSATDPILLGIVPTREPTVEHVYTFLGWDAPLENVTGDRGIKAIYAESIRTYTVTWRADIGGVVIDQKTSVTPHSLVQYSGPDVPAKDGYFWVGWSEETNDIVSDMDVYAIFVELTNPVSYNPAIQCLYDNSQAEQSRFKLQELLWILSQPIDVITTYLQIGDYIKIYVPANDIIKDQYFSFYVFDFNRYRMSDGGEFAPVVFGMANETTEVSCLMNSTATNSGGWRDCLARSFLNDRVFHILPVWLKQCIKVVDVRGTAGDTSSEILISSDRLFLFSYAETSGANSYRIEVEDEVLAQGENFAVLHLYRANPYLIGNKKDESGRRRPWWTRSPSLLNGTNFMGYRYDGWIWDKQANMRDDGGMFLSFGFCV